MISRRLLVAIAGCHAVFIIAQIYLYTQYIAESYALQKNEQLLTQIKMNHQEYMVKWHRLHDLSEVQKIALDTLKLQKIHLSQIKRLQTNDYATQ